MVVCDVCSKSFKRRDNMLRHKKTMHGEDPEESDTDIDDVSEESEGESDDQNKDNEGDDTGDETSETDVDQSELNEDPWDSIIQSAFKQCQVEFEEDVQDLLDTTEMTEEKARSKAFKNMRPIYRKTMKDVFTKKMIWFHVMKTDPIYKSIKKTAEYLKNIDDYEDEESWKYAISKRKYLFDKILQNYNPPEVQSHLDVSGDSGGDAVSASDDDDDFNPKKREKKTSG